jgi:hypothetical protein
VAALILKAFFYTAAFGHGKLYSRAFDFKGQNAEK